MGFIILMQGKVTALFSGHNTICVAVAVIELGLVETADNLNFKLESPGGVIDIEAEMNEGRIISVSIVGMKSFVEKQDLSTDRKEIIDLLPVNSINRIGIYTPIGRSSLYTVWLHIKMYSY